jgi:hypothetical protein
MPKKKSEAESHFNRFKDMLKHIVGVPKSEIEKREKTYKKQRAKLKKARTRALAR